MVDFYKTYRIDLRGLEDGTLDPVFMSILLDGLPSNCETNKILYPDLALSVSEWLLNSIEFQLRISNYRWSEDAKYKRNQPEMLFKPASNGLTKSDDEELQSMEIDAMKSIVSLLTPGGD